MAKTIIGRNLPLYKGEYSTATVYDRFDVVLYDGSSYVSKLPNNQNKPVTNTTYWQLLAQRGEFTEQQLEDFKAEVVAESKEEMDDYIDDKKAELDTYEGTKEAELNTYATGLKNVFDSNATEKTTAFNTNATEKTTEFNNNVSSKTETFNTNASTKTTAFDNNATSKTTAFNTNATNKTTDFNDNATAKTNAFNTNASDKTDDFNDNATEKTTTFDEHVEQKTEEFDENVEALQQEIDELSENMPWNTTEQGTEIQVTDAAKYSKNKLELFGSTSQVGTAGINLLDLANFNQYSGNGIGIEINDDRSFKINGTATQGFSYIRSIPNELILNGDYTLILKCTKNISPNTLTITLGAGSAISSTQVQNLKSNGINIRNFTLDNRSVNQIRGYINNGNSFDNSEFQLYLLQGTYTEDNLPDYEPYTGGQPSPNPDYPQDIHVVTGENTIEVQGKNLLPANQIRTDKDWLIVNDDGSVTINYPSGNALNQINLFMTPINIPESTYRMKIFVEGTFKGGNLILQDINGNWRQQKSITDGQVFSFSSLRNMQIWNIDAGTNCTIKFELEEGTTEPTEYQKYYHADYPINLGSFELCKIGDYQDYLYKKNGNWYKYEAIKEWKSEDYVNNVWKKTQTSDEYSYFFTNSKDTLIKSGIYNGYCNLLNVSKSLLVAGTEVKTDTISYGDSGYAKIRIKIKTNRLSEDSIQGLKNWFGSVDVTSLIILATPTSTQITDETLIAQLDEIYEHLKLAKGTNNITVTAEDLAPNMQLTYMQDLPSKLDNLDSRLALLE